MGRGILKCVRQKTHNPKARKARQSVDTTEVCQTGREGWLRREPGKVSHTFQAHAKLQDCVYQQAWQQLKPKCQKYLEIPFILARTIQSCARYFLGTLLQKSTSPVQRGERDAHCKLTLCLGGNCYIPDVSFWASAAPAPSYPHPDRRLSLFLFFEKWCLSNPASQQTLMG